jgi:V8-like Glu-specific endopeptidase
VRSTPARLLRLFVVLLALATWPSADAHGAPPQPTDTVAEVEISPDEREAAEKYWTPDRMADAIQHSMDLARADALGASRMTSSASSTEFVADDLYATLPYRATGKAFFHNPADGRDYVCSASAVGGRVVLTAGHCVSNGAGSFHTNWIFVPAYKDGSEPYGRWTALRLVTFDEWYSQKNYCRDVGFAVVADVDSQTLARTLGGALQLTYNQSPTRTWQALGYPTNSPWGGQDMVETVADFERSSQVHGCTPLAMCIVSQMQGGASGGPWLTTTGGSLAGGVTSYNTVSDGVLCSPTFDDAVEALVPQYDTYLPLIRRE